MRLIGMAERALELMCRRTSQRVAFGKPVSEQGVTVERIAECRIMIEQARLLTLHAAHRMDTVGNKVAKAEIAMIKVAVPAWPARWSTGPSRPMAAAAPATTSAWPTPTPCPRACCAWPTGPDEVHATISRLGKASSTVSHRIAVSTSK
jgi:hypothetical protein